jgi:hypothetical protein
MALGKKKLNAADVQIAARGAFAKILMPLSEFALNSGISVSELNSILRQSAIRRVAARQLSDNRRKYFRYRRSDGNF